MKSISRPYQPAYLDVETAVCNGHAIIRLLGELDMGSETVLADAVQSARDQGAATVVLDMTGLEFLDCSGVARLVKSLHAQRRCGGELILHAPSRATLRVLEILGLSASFHIS